jgi:hypothetical protein
MSGTHGLLAYITALQSRSVKKEEEKIGPVN